jgi:hypothetical protein
MKKPITLIWFHEHSYFYFTWFGSQKIGMTSNLEGSIVYRLGNTINLSVLVFYNKQLYGLSRHLTKQIFI